MFTEKFPYSDFHNLNLDWILETVKNLEKTMSDFIVLNSVTYANPLEWDITRNYPKNQVVLDSNGDGYLSVAPVPVGVEITNTDYWTKIGNFSELWSSVKKAITPFDEGVATTATVAHVVDDLVWLNNDLYVITKDIDAGTRYVVGTNCAKTSIDARLSNLAKEIDATNSNLATQVKAITDKITTLQTDVSGKVDKNTTGALAQTVTGTYSLQQNGRNILSCDGSSIYIGTATRNIPVSISGTPQFLTQDVVNIDDNYAYVNMRVGTEKVNTKFLVSRTGALPVSIAPSPKSIEEFQTLKKDGTDDITNTLNTYTKQFPLFIPQGTYKISRPVQLKHSLYGAGASRDPARGTSDTILQYTATPGSFGSLGVLTVSGDDVSGNVVIANLDIVCGGMIGGIVFTTNKYTDNSVYNVSVSKVKSYGVYLQPANTTLNRYCYMDNVSVWGYSDDKPAERFTGNVAFYWGDKSPDCECNNLLAMVCQTGFDCRTNVYGCNWTTYNGIPSGGTGGATANTWWENTCGLKVTNNDVHITNLYLDTVRRGVIFDGPGKAAAFVNNLLFTCNDDTANSGQTYGTVALIGTSPSPQFIVSGGIINKSAKIDTIVQTTGTYPVHRMNCTLDGVYIYTDRATLFPSSGQKVCKIGEHRLIDAAITNQTNYIVAGQTTTGDPNQYKAFAYIPIGQSNASETCNGIITVSDRNNQLYRIYVNTYTPSVIAENLQQNVDKISAQPSSTTLYNAVYNVINSTSLYYTIDRDNGCLILYLRRPASYQYTVNVSNFPTYASPVILDRVRNLDGTPVDFPRWSSSSGMTPVKVMTISKFATTT